MKEIILLGATGSIGTQCLDVIRGNKFILKGFSFGNNIKQAIKIIEEFHPLYVCCKEEIDKKTLENKYPNIIFFNGNRGLINLAKVDLSKGVLVNALMGMVGFLPTIEAIKTHKDILLANKETLVVGGEIIKKLLKEYKVKLLPIDSEHSAIFQCLKAGKKKEVKRLIITASGGALRDKTRSELENVTVEDALKHPNWQMGAKITIDSSTMVNKGLEVIEAHYLFDMPYDKIETILHKESIVHSMVEFNDGVVMAQMGNADMRIPLSYALNYPNHKEINNSLGFDLESLNQLTFKKMDFERFPMLALAYYVGKIGGILPLVYNSANEVCVNLFIKKKIKYLDIEKIIYDMVKYYENKNIFDISIDDIISIDKEIRKKIMEKFEVD